MPELSEAQTSDSYSWLADAALESSTEAPPLPTNQTADSATESGQSGTESKVDGEAGSEKPEGEAPKAEAKPVVDDPDLDKDENAAVHALPAEQQQALKSKIKETKQKASFQSRLFDPLENPGGTIDEIAKRSPSKGAALQAEYIKRAVSNSDEFLNEYEKRDEQGYQRLATSVYQGHKPWFVEQAKKEPEIASALEFFQQNKDAHLGEIPDDVLNELRDLELEEDFKATAKFLQDMRARNVPLRPDIKAKLEELETLKAQGAKKPEDETGKTEAKSGIDQKAWDDIWWGKENSVYGTLENYARSKAAEQYGLKVTPEERKANPQMAALKQIKLDYLIEGGADIPPFDDAFAAWAGERADFKARMNRIGKFAAASERDNAIAAARELYSDLDIYLDERIKHPLFTVLDQVTGILASRSNNKPVGEKYLPGGGAQPPSTPAREMSDWVAETVLSLP